MAVKIDYVGGTVRLPDPWERQPSEPPAAFDAFKIYRDAETKISAEKVGEKCGKSDSLTSKWCTKFRWVERRTAWLDELDRQARESFFKGITGMRKNHIDIARAMLIKAAKALQEIPSNEMTMQDIAKAVDVAAKLERLSRGEVTERTEGNTAVSGKLTVSNDPYEELTTEELKRLAALADESQD